jgi:hypothetical protein
VADPAPLGSCCQRLFDVLEQKLDVKTIFEREGMLALTSGWNRADETSPGFTERHFARFCPFCGEKLHMPDDVKAPWAKGIN